MKAPGLGDLKRLSTRPVPSTDPALWTKRRAFGPAGGPDEIALTHEGSERAFTVGARVMRGAPAKALRLLAAMGGEGSLHERVPGSAKIRPTNLGRIDQIAWGHLRDKGYVESVAPGGVRITAAGRVAVARGLEEQASLLERCKVAATGNVIYLNPRRKAVVL